MKKPTFTARVVVKLSEAQVRMLLLVIEDGMVLHPTEGDELARVLRAPLKVRP